MPIKGHCIMSVTVSSCHMRSDHYYLSTFHTWKFGILSKRTRAYDIYISLATHQKRSGSEIRSCSDPATDGVSGVLDHGISFCESWVSLGTFSVLRQYSNASSMIANPSWISSSEIVKGGAIRKLLSQHALGAVQHQQHQILTSRPYPPAVPHCKTTHSPCT